LVPDWDVAARSLVATGLAHPIDAQETDTHSGIRLRHALVAEALLAALSVAERASLHLRLAGAIETAHGNDLDPADVEALAVHLSAGDAVERAAPWAAQVADHLVARGGHVRATQLYELAMADVAAAAPTDRAGFFERAATAAATAGRKDLARTWGLSAVAAREAEGRSWQTFGSWVNPVLMRLLNDSTDPTPASAAGGPEASGADLDPTNRDTFTQPGTTDDDARTNDPEAEALVAEAQAAIDDGDLARGHALAVEADRLAREANDQASRANAALVFLYAGDPDRADAVLDEVAITAREARDWATVSVARSRSCRIPMARGYVGDAAERNAVGADAGKRAGGPEFWAHLTLGTAFIETLAGEVRAAEARCDEALQFDLPMLPEIAKASRSNIALELGNLDEARNVLGSLVPGSRVLGVVYFSYPILTLQARLHLLEGDAVSAPDTIDELDALGASPFHEFGVDPRLTRAIAFHLLGDDRGVHLVRAGLDELTATFDGPNNLAARSFVAALSFVAANPAAAADLFERAGIDWERAPRWPFAAEAYCEAGLCLASTDTDRALRLVRRALVLARRSGLDRVAWRAAVLESMCASLVPPSGDPVNPSSNATGGIPSFDAGAHLVDGSADARWVSEVLASLTNANARSPNSWPRVRRTRRSERCSSCPTRRFATTSRRRLPSWESPDARRWPHCSNGAIHDIGPPPTSSSREPG